MLCGMGEHLSRDIQRLNGIIQTVFVFITQRNTDDLLRMPHRVVGAFCDEASDTWIARYEQQYASLFRSSEKR